MSKEGEGMVKKTKAELFKENPEKFIHMDDLVLATKLNDDGKVVTLIGSGFTRDHLYLSLMYMKEKVMDTVALMKMIRAKELAAQDRIIKPGVKH